MILNLSNDLRVHCVGLKGLMDDILSISDYFDLFLY